MSLSNSQKKYLRGLTHHLDPVVMIADKGLSENVRSEIELALEHHELVKIRLRTERDERQGLITEISKDFSAELIHSIGQVASFYRRHPKKPKLELPA